MNEPVVGGHGLPYDAQEMVTDMIIALNEKYHFHQGQVAAFWAVAYTLAQHLGAEKQRGIPTTQQGDTE